MESRMSVARYACLFSKTAAVFSVVFCSLSQWPLAADPAAPGWKEQLARAQEKNDQAAVVEICRRQLDRAGKNDLELLTTMFNAQVTVSDYVRAGLTLNRMEKAGSPAGQLEELRGDIASFLDRPTEEAVGHWRAALQAQPARAASVLGKIADAYDKKHTWPEAVEALRAFLRVKPEHAARQARLAVCLLNTGQPEAADKEIAAANRLDAADETVKAATPIFDRLRPQLAAIHTLDARIAAGKSGGPMYDVRTGANTPEAARLDRALILYRAGAHDAALQDLSVLAERTGGRALAARLLQAQCLWLTNRWEEAAALRAGKMNNDNWFYDRVRMDRLRIADTPITAEGDGFTAKQHVARAGLLLDAGQPGLLLEEAEAGIRAGEKTGPLANEAQVVYAAALLQNDRGTEALTAARRATEMDPKNPEAWALRGRLEENARADYPAAVDSLSRALAMRNEPAWLRRRESCLRILGRLAEADRDARGLPASP